jgi:hypothetical protein
MGTIVSILWFEIVGQFFETCIYILPKHRRIYHMEEFI